MYSMCACSYAENWWVLLLYFYFQEVKRSEKLFSLPLWNWHYIIAMSEPEQKQCSRKEPRENPQMLLNSSQHTLHGECAYMHVCLLVTPRWVRPEGKEGKCSEYEGQNWEFVGEVRRKRGIPLVGQIFTTPSHWSVSDRPFVFHKAGHSSKAAIKSRTFSPIIPLTWTPTPNPADVPVFAFVFCAAHFGPVPHSKNSPTRQMLPSVFTSRHYRLGRMFPDVKKSFCVITYGCRPWFLRELVWVSCNYYVTLWSFTKVKITNIITSQMQKSDYFTDSASAVCHTREASYKWRNYN